MREAIITGAGPAGISAAIYLARAGFPVTVIYRDRGALEKAELIENYYGFPKPVKGAELFDRGIEQARRLGVKILRDEVVGLNWGEKLTILTKTASYPGDVVILATGAARIAPKIEGLKRLEGYGVSYCAVCDAFFYRNKDVAVLGSGEYALHEASELLGTSASVTLYTMGKDVAFEVPDNPKLRIERRKITRLIGENALESLELEDGSVIPTAGLFVAVGVAGSADFAKKVGAQVEGAKIVVDDDGATTIEGLYACGDCTGGMLQVAKAVYEGARTAKHAIAYLRQLG